LQQLVSDTWSDAQTITLAEFLSSFLGIGGFDASLLKQLWDLAIATTNSNVPNEIDLSAVTESLYCSELNISTLASDLSSSSMTTEAQNAVVAAANSITDSKLSLWAFVGSTQASGLDCSAFVCNQFTLSIVGDNASGDTALNVPAGLYNVEINGRYATRDNGRTYDGMYFYSGGDPDFQSPQPLLAAGTQVTVEPVSPRNTSNTGYSTTYNHPGGDLQIINADPQVDDNEPGVVSLTFNPV
jgi:hypothetical protein